MTILTRPASPPWPAHMLPLHRGWQAIRLMDSSLRVLVDTAADAGEPSPVFNPRWVQQVLQTGEPAVSTVFKDPSSGQWVVSVGVAVKRRGSIKHVLGVRLFAQNFSDILNRTRLPADGVVALLDTDRRIIARNLNQDRYIGGLPAPDFVGAKPVRYRGNVADDACSREYRPTLRG